VVMAISLLPASLTHKVSGGAPRPTAAHSASGLSGAGACSGSGMGGRGGGASRWLGFAAASNAVAAQHKSAMIAMRAHGNGAVLAATDGELDELIGFVAAEVNHEPNRRRQHRLDAAFTALTGAAGR